MKLKTIVKRFLLIVGMLLIVFIVNVAYFAWNANRLSKGNAITMSDVEKPVLLVIDIQEATTGEVSTYPYYVEQSNKLIANTNEIIRCAENCDIPVIIITNMVSNRLINVLNDSYAAGSIGVQPDYRLDTENGYILSKTRKDAFSNIQLDSLLIKLEVNSLYVCGLDAAHCVNSTLLSAQQRNYSLNVIHDALLSESKELKHEMLNAYKEREINLISIEETKIVFSSITDFLLDVS